MQRVIDLALDVFDVLYGFIKGMIVWLIDSFFDIPLFEKLIVITSIGAFFSVIMPVAHYYIFESWFSINNPLAVYMIGLFFIMVGTLFLSPLSAVIIRGIMISWYLIAFIVMHVTGSLSAAPYELLAGYYVNIGTVVLFFVFSALSFLVSYRSF